MRTPMFGKSYKSRKAKKRTMQEKIAKRIALQEEDELAGRAPRYRTNRNGHSQELDAIRVLRGLKTLP